MFFWNSFGLVFGGFTYYFQFHTLTGSKLHFSESINFAIDFDQVFGRIFWKFWYESIRQALFYENMRRVKIEIHFETILDDLLGLGWIPVRAGVTTNKG